MEHGYFIKSIEHAQDRVEKPCKSTLFQTSRVLAGINTIWPNSIGVLSYY
jgi:hypothetical protein